MGGMQGTETQKVMSAIMKAWKRTTVMMTIDDGKRGGETTPKSSGRLEARSRERNRLIETSILGT